MTDDWELDSVKRMTDSTTNSVSNGSNSKGLKPAAYLSEREYPDPMANDQRSHISKEGAKINPGKRDFEKDEIQSLFAGEDIIQSNPFNELGGALDDLKSSLQDLHYHNNSEVQRKADHLEDQLNRALEALENLKSSLEVED